MKLEPAIIWVVFFVVFTIVKGLAKKADKSRGNTNVSTSGGSGHDPLQDFFNQLDNVKTTKTTSAKKPEVKNVEDFFKVKPIEKRQKKQVISTKAKPVKKVKVKDAQESAKVFVKKPWRTPYKSAEQESCCDMQDAILDLTEEHAFQSASIGEEGKVDKFGDNVYNKHRYEVKGREQLKQAIVWAEILKKPKALQ